MNDCDCVKDLKIYENRDVYQCIVNFGKLAERSGFHGICTCDRGVSKGEEREKRERDTW